LSRSMETINLSNFIRRHWFLTILMILIPVSASILYGLENWLLLFGPPLLLVLLFVLFNFELSLYLLIVTMMFSGFWVIYGGRITLPVWFMEVVFLSFIAKALVSGKISISRTPLDKAILIFMAAITLSLVNVSYPYLAAQDYLWHIHIFILFYIVAGNVKSSSLRNFISFLIFLAVLHSISPLVQSILTSGAKRAFGIGYLYAAALTEISFMLCLSFFFFEQRSTYKMLWGTALLILLAACLVHKTRGAVIGLTTAYIFMNMVFFKKSIEQRLRFVLKNMVISSLAIVSAVILMSYKLSILSGSFTHHLYSYTTPIDTMQIRFILWNLALKFFSKNPILGIGLGQFSKLSTLNLEPKYQVFYYPLAGLGTHNLFLGYLCETGIIGALGFLFLLFSALKLAWSKYKVSTTPVDLKLSGALLGTLFYIVITSLYSGAWTWGTPGMMFAFILAWVVVFKPNSSK
jgi:O-antigen ligase